MYRRAAAQGPLQGVAAGAFTGGTRVIDAGKLSRAAKKRLVDCLSGRGEPSPIAYDRPSALASSVRAAWGAVVAVIVLVLTFARGFDHPSSAWEVQPRAAIAIYLLACALFAFSLLAILRQRFLLGGEALRPGRYLLSLDLVQISPIDSRGRQRITVRPLGDARDAVIRGEGRKTELVITFADTSHVTFALRGDAGGQVTLRRLEHAQRLLEELTYTKDLSQSFAHDPFFDLRADGSWSSAAATEEDAPPSLRTKRSFVAGRGGPALAAVATVALAFASLGIRNGLARRLIAAREQRAERERMIADLKAKRARREEEEDKLREAAMNASLPSPKTAANCLAAFREKASPAHPEVPKILEAMLAQIDRDRDPHLAVVWRRSETNVAGGVSEVQWAEREKTTVDTFSRVLSETCPANVMRFSHDNVALPIPRWGLFVDYGVSWPKSWTVRRRGALGETMNVMALNVVFDVKLVGPNDSGTASFRLSMPPANKLTMAHRAQSIFPSNLEDDGTYDERVYESMTARAFDRLYDEIWSLFFAGNPKVPLDRSPTNARAGTGP